MAAWLVLLNASLIGAGALTLSTSDAFGDVFGTKSSLHRSWRDAKLFYSLFSGLILAACAIVLTPGRPARDDHRSGTGTRGRGAPQRQRVSPAAVQRPRGARPLAQPTLARRPRQRHRRGARAALADPDGHHRVPNIDVTAFALIGGAVLAAALLIFGLATLRARRRVVAVTVTQAEPQVPKAQWTMPPLALLARPQWSSGRKIAMLTLGGYLVAAVILLIVKATRLGGG